MRSSDASKLIKNYKEQQGKIPQQTIIENKTLRADDYLYAASNTIINLNQNKRVEITFNSIQPPPKPAGTATGTLTKQEYLQAAQNTKNFIETKKRSPNYATTKIGQIRYETLIYTFAKIINHYNTTGKLPNSIQITQTTGIGGTITKDTTPPLTSISPDPGVYDHPITVTITATDNKDSNPIINYQVDGRSYTGNRIATISLGEGTHTINYYAIDKNGNKAQQQTATYIIGEDTPVRCSLTLTSTAFTGGPVLNLDKLHDFYEIYGMSPEEYFMVNYGDPYVWEYEPVPEVYDLGLVPFRVSLPVTVDCPAKGISVAWRRTAPFEGEISIIVDRRTICTKRYINGAWIPIKDKIEQINASEFYNDIVSQLAILKLNNLTGTTEGQMLWQIHQYGLEYLNNLTGDDIRDYTLQHLEELAKDTLHITIDYPGEAKKTIMGLPFGGAPVNRNFTIYHIKNFNGTYNGAYDDPELGMIDAGYQGIVSYTVATTKISDNLLREWLTRKPQTPGTIKAAYGTTLAALEMIYLHDKLADEIAKNTNITWTRTKPIIVSVADTPKDTFMIPGRRLPDRPTTRLPRMLHEKLFRRNKIRNR